MTTPPLRLDALLPPEMAAKAEELGVRKAGLDAVTMLVLAVLGGSFIGLGGALCMTTVAGAAALPYGLGRLAAGVAFSLGLVLIIVAGAELFTGNNLIVMAWASGRVPTWRLLRNWLLVYAGNFAGAVATALLVFLGGQYLFGAGQVGAAALAAAEAKCALPFGQALVLGVLANALVCLAVWLTFSAHSTTDKIVAIVPPITAFVALGFEHSIANMYLVPLALLVKTGAPDAFWALIGRAAADYPHLTWERFFVGNLLPVTLGNVVGGAGLVGLVYWFAYLRPGRRRRAP